jgi:hypothetical protein
VKTGAVILAGGTFAVACTLQTILPYGGGPQAGTASQIVGAGGGIVTADDGTTLLIPPMALASDVTITIGLDPSPAPLTQARELAPAHVFGPEGQTFLLPVCVTLAFEPGLLPEGTTQANVVLYAMLPDAGRYAPLPTMAADPTHVTGMTTQLSETMAAVGDVLEVDAGPDGDTCDGSAIEAGEAGL